MLNVKTILHPTDFSEYSDIAFKMACALANDYGAKLVLMHVAPPPVYIYGEGIVPPAPERPLEELREKLLAIQPKRIEQPVEHILAEGDTVDEILRVAEDCGADLIVIGTHGRGGIARFLLGSVAEKVVRKAKCPVVSVKKPAASESHVEPRAPREVAVGETFGVWP